MLFCQFSASSAVSRQFSRGPNRPSDRQFVGLCNRRIGLNFLSTQDAGGVKPLAIRFAASRGEATIESSPEQLINGAQGYEKDR